MTRKKVSITGAAGRIGQVLRQGLTARYGIFYGISANQWAYWAIENARQLVGYEPQDAAERYA